MNQNIMMDKLSVLAKLTAIITLIFSVVACKPEGSGPQTPPIPETKVVKSISRKVESFYTHSVIRVIAADGKVAIGLPRTSLEHCLRGRNGHTFFLEGKAQLGDRAVAVFYLEDQVLENGEVRTVIKAVRIRSVNNQDLEKHFSDTQGDDQLPEQNKSTDATDLPSQREASSP